jgi:hypothetical protein
MAVDALDNVAHFFALGFKIRQLEDRYVISFLDGEAYLLCERFCSWSKQSTSGTRDSQLIIG